MRRYEMKEVSESVGGEETNRAPREVLVPEARGLLEREEHAADGRAERRRYAGRGAGAHEVALVDVVAEVREQFGQERHAALRDDRADRRARVDHRALLTATASEQRGSELSRRSDWTRSQIK